MADRPDEGPVWTARYLHQPETPSPSPLIQGDRAAFKVIIHMALCNDFAGRVGLGCAKVLDLVRSCLSWICAVRTARYCPLSPKSFAHLQPTERRSVAANDLGERVG